MGEYLQVLLKILIIFIIVEVFTLLICLLIRLFFYKIVDFGYLAIVVNKNKPKYYVARGFFYNPLFTKLIILKISSLPSALVARIIAREQIDDNELMAALCISGSKAELKLPGFFNNSEKEVSNSND